MQEWYQYEVLKGQGLGTHPGEWDYSEPDSKVTSSVQMHGLIVVYEFKHFRLLFLLS